MSKDHINNNFIKILLISSIFIVLTLLEFSYVDVIFGEEVITTIPVGDSPIGLTFNPFNNNMYIANAESDNVSDKDPEKIVIQQNPEIDNIVVDSTPIPLLLQVLQSLDSDCDTCFAPESDGGTLPKPRVDDLIDYLADPDNIVPIGADPDVNSIAELCAAIVAAVGTADPVSEQDIRDLLNDALRNETPGQVQQVIDCLVLAGLITEPQIVVNTSIDSAIDGNEDPVENLSSTTSNDINFTFSGQITPEDTEVDSQGFLCKLDDQEFVPCDGPTTINFTGSQFYSGLPLGDHTFSVVAFVVVNEQPIFDQTPETFTWTIEPIVVNTSIDSAIDGNEDPVENLSSTTSNDINFTFSGQITPEDTEVDSQGFLCKLDDQEFVPCDGPTTINFTGSQFYSGLPLGNHTFSVVAFVVVNEQPIFDQTPETFTWTIEPIVVNTSIDSAIDGNEDPVENLSSTTSNDINFTFSGQITPEDTEVDSQGFLCKLDDQEFVPCDGPTTINFTGSQFYSGLPLGNHTFSVVAFVVVNEQPIFDQTPETFTWTIEPIVVNTSIDSAIDGNEDPVENLSSTTSNDINFTFSGQITPEDTEVDSQGFLCKLDDQEFVPCDGPTTINFTGSQFYSGLPLGNHTFSVVAFVVVNEQPIFDQTPETFTWTIEPIVVNTSIDSAIDGNEDPVENLSSTTSNDINFTFSGQITPEDTEVDSQGFLCKLDDQEFVPCDGPTTINFTGSQFYSGLPLGNHTFSVVAFVVVNEQPIFDQTPETFTWTIEPIVVNTSIDSAIDGNEDPVENLSSTTSNDIEFEFSGTTNAQVVTERGFECELDGEVIACTDRYERILY